VRIFRALRQGDYEINFMMLPDTATDSVTRPTGAQVCATTEQLRTADHVLAYPHSENNKLNCFTI
jgi:hypothetical protein